MRVTKFVHSCLLVETPDRVVLFDPGAMSVNALDLSQIDRLDDILITHVHGDHCDVGLIKQVILKFPSARITTNSEVKAVLALEGITASDQAPQGVKFFHSPHENVMPIFKQPEQKGFHWLDMVTNPGDSHSFKETKPVLALPISGPWGSTVKALNLALELKPKYVLPIHDWHMRDESRLMFYDIFERLLGEQGIIFFKLETGCSVNIDL